MITPVTKRKDVCMRNRFRKLLICGAAVAVAFFGVSSTSQAATAAPARSSTSTVTTARIAAAIAHLPASVAAPHVVASHAVAGGTILDVAAGAPSGCAYGAVCFYNNGNGGNLCGSYYNSENLGRCANIGPSGSIYNNGRGCSGCHPNVNLYYDSDQQGAFYCLPQGHYLLYIEQNFFNRGGAGADGLGQSLAYDPSSPNGPGGVASMGWTVTC